MEIKIVDVDVENIDISSTVKTARKINTFLVNNSVSRYDLEEIVNQNTNVFQDEDGWDFNMIPTAGTHGMSSSTERRLKQGLQVIKTRLDNKYVQLVESYGFLYKSLMNIETILIDCNETNPIENLTSLYMESRSESQPLISLDFDYRSFDFSTIDIIRGDSIRIREVNDPILNEQILKINYNTEVSTDNFKDYTPSTTVDYSPYSCSILKYLTDSDKVTFEVVSDLIANRSKAVEKISNILKDITTFMALLKSNTSWDDMDDKTLNRWLTFDHDMSKYNTLTYDYNSIVVLKFITQLKK